LNKVPILEIFIDLTWINISQGRLKNKVLYICCSSLLYFVVFNWFTILFQVSIPYVKV
jgi:hypothetical protein